MSPSWPYVALAAVVGVPCAVWFTALPVAILAALIATNLAFSCAFRIWGDDVDA